MYKIEKLFLIFLTIFLIGCSEPQDTRTNKEKLKDCHVSLAFNLPKPDNNVRVYYFNCNGHIHYVAANGIGIKSAHTSGGKISHTVTTDTIGTK